MGVRQREVEYEVLELAGVRYAVVGEGGFLGMCRRAGMVGRARGAAARENEKGGWEGMDGGGIARRVADRRKRAGMSQGELARRAGVRVETVNRIERGHVMPDFRTIRKLVEAMGELAHIAKGAAV